MLFRSVSQSRYVGGKVLRVTSGITSATNDVWEGFDDDLKEPQASGASYRGGGYISAPEPSWTEQNEQRRIRSKVRNRLRKRFHTKRPRDE